jgi:hypothetical protein
VKWTALLVKELEGRGRGVQMQMEMGIVNDRKKARVHRSWEAAILVIAVPIK